MNASRIVGLVLAAGRSTRMGPDRNKLLESIGGRPLVSLPITALREAGLERIVVVLGYEAGRVRAVLPDFAEPIVHDGFADGMGGSLAAGARHIRRLDPDAAILVCMADLPRLSAAPVRRLVEALADAPNDAIGVPTASGRSGHPVLFGPGRAGELEACAGDEGARRIVRAAGASVIEVEVGTSAILDDVDTPDDLAR